MTIDKRIVLTLALAFAGIFGVIGFFKLGESSTNYHRSVSLDKELYNSFTIVNASATEPEPTSLVYSAVVPHHLAAGRYIEELFNSLKDQKPPVVVVVGPNHEDAGFDQVVTSRFVWKTPYGEIDPASDIINGLVGSKQSFVDEPVIGGEASIGAVVPFVKKTWPSAKMVPIILKSKASSSTLSALANSLVNQLPKGSLLIASVDFSHYQPLFIAQFHDRLSEEVLRAGDTRRVEKLEVDSPNSLFVLLEYNKIKGGAEFHETAHTNSATIAGHPDWNETTSHVIGYFTGGQKAQENTMTLQFFGDMMLDRTVAAKMGKDGFDYLFKNIRGQEDRFFKGADLFMVNLEGPFAPYRVSTTKSIAFRFDPALASSLKKFNIGAVTLANNHSQDMTKANVLFTEKTLNAKGIRYCGRQYADGPEFNLVLETSTSQFPEPIAFVCTEWVGHPPNKTALEKAIIEAKNKARIVIVEAHGGEEYKTISTQKQRDLYHWFIDQGVTAVIGHHPHVVEELEVYKGKPIVYSLGNFIFDQYFAKNTQEGLSVGLVIQGDQVKELHLFPLFGVRSQVQLMTGERRAEYLRELEKNSRLEGKKIENGVLTF